MVKVSKSSWHYKLVNSYGLTDNKNLCKYFWAVLFSLMLIPCSVVGVIVCMPFLLVASPFVLLYKWLSKKEDSLLLLWLRAKKQKVCPLIEYVE
jgi:hypothetical protein